MKRPVVFCGAVFVLLLPWLAAAQVDRATLTGIVTDSAGGVLPGATVTVTNAATNFSSQQQTTSSGSFLFVNLIPGVYEITIELTGFKKSVQTQILEVGQRGRVVGVLEVGAFTESVNVTESTRRLNANDATLGAVIPQTQVSNLPLAIRNWDDLLALVPGVQGDRYTEQGGGTSFGRTGGINVHGAVRCRTTFSSTASTTTASRKTSRN
jgi:Carboxypeptidase regulatory-like domain